MSSDAWWSRVRTLDIRVFAAAVAALLLIGGVMWVVLIPKNPEPGNFAFEKTARRDLSAAHSLQIGSPVQGRLVDGSDYDFYRIGPLPTAAGIRLHMTNRSAALIPALLVFDENRNTVVDKTADYLHSPGSDVDATFLAQPKTAYYIQVFSQRNTIGSYALTADYSTEENTSR